MQFNILGKEFFVKKPVLAILSAIVILILGVSGYVIKSSGGTIIVEKTSTNNEKSTVSALAYSQEDSSKQDIVKNKATDEIKVYVTGCVKKSGVYTLKKDEIILDAINAAGGATNEADIENINLAYKLRENVMLKIKSKRDTLSVSQAGEAGKGMEVVSDSGGAVVSNVTTPGKQNSKVNINTATEAELDTLPGIGKGIANDIIAYRENNGSFKDIKDIMKVPGIKEKLFSKIKDSIVAE